MTGIKEMQPRSRTIGQDPAKELNHAVWKSSTAPSTIRAPDKQIPRYGAGEEQVQCGRDRVVLAVLVIDQEHSKDDDMT